MSSSAPNYAKFKLVSNLGETHLLTEIENNLKYYLDWALLSIGGWTNIIIYTPDVTDGYGGSPETLRWVSDPSYTDGQVWQGFRKDWVWESGVNFIDDDDITRNPIDIQDSGVRVSGSFTDIPGYHINYPLGRVVFDKPVATSSAVDLLYSYRTVQVLVADDAPWWRELQLRSLRSDDIHFTQSDRTGDWSIGAHERIQLPAIIIEAVPRGRSHGYELGNTALWVEQDIIFHILSDDRNMRNKLVSILEVQNDHVIWLFDSDVIAASGAFPLDFRGERIGTNVYTDFVDSDLYRWKKCTFKNSVVSEVDSWHPRLYEGTVRTTCEIIVGSA